MQATKTKECALPERTTPKETSPATSDTQSIPEGLKLTPVLPDMDSILGPLISPPQMPDMDSILEPLISPPQMPDMDSILGPLISPPQMPDMDSILESFGPNFALTDVTSVDPDPFLITRPSPSDAILRSALEINFRFVLVPTMWTAEASEHEVPFDSAYWQMFSEYERCLRRIIKEALVHLVGPNWIRQRVPQGIRDKWQERQSQDRAVGRPVSDAIQYADFIDLLSIITRGDN